MKRIAENRYPHSATLFKFCKEALSIRYDGNVKVIDQDVGAILGYDPADCSHWKKGKKNIRSLSTLKNLAEHLQIDEHLLIEIASGKVDLEEAVFEFKGYGSFGLQGQNLDLYKKSFFKNPERWQRDGRTQSFEEIFDLNRDAILRLTERVLREGFFTEAPLYIPELVHLVKNLEIIHDADLPQNLSINYATEGGELRLSIRYRNSEIRPYVRFLIAKEFFVFLSKSKNDMARDFFNSPDELLDIQGNIFAGLLLVSPGQLRKEVERLDSSLDIINQLARTFWVSKALMNKRLADYIDHLS